MNYASTGPSLTHDSTDGTIRFTVAANGKVMGSWDLAYFVTFGGTRSGTGSVTAGTVAGTSIELLLQGTNVVTKNDGTSSTSVPFPSTPLTVQEVCDGRVVADWIQTVNGTRQQMGVEAAPVPSP